MAVDHSTEYICWDDVEAGYVELKNGTRPVILQRISVMMRGPWTRKADGSAFQFDGQVIAFSIPNKLLNPNGEDRTITRDDVIVDADDKRYNVLYSEASVNGSHWYCATCAER
jgi:hypothetical protein